MLKSIVLFCSFICIHVAYAQEKIAYTGSNISAKDAQELLSHHNKVRKDVGTKPLIWSAQLAKYAQEWANHLATENNCKMVHRIAPGQDEKVYGENIFWGSDGKYFKPIDASVEWYSEIKMYNYTKVTEKNWEPTGHYTQMIWDNTKEVGVGVSICPNGGIIIVANYYPAGNYLRQYPY
jgi:pathogenesis-related protein 1